MHRLASIVIVLLATLACGNPRVKPVEINGMDCRVNTSKIGGEACCKVREGWRYLDASGTRSSFVTTSSRVCDPGDP